MFYERRWPELEHLLGIAWARLEAGPHQVRTREGLLLFAATMARIQGDAEAAVAHSAETLQLLSRPGVEDPTATAYRAIAQNNLGSAELWLGRVTAAEESLRAALLITRESRIEVSEINALSHLGLAAVLSGRVSEAVAPAEEAGALVERRGWAPLPQSATSDLALALVALQRHEVATAQEQVVRAREAAHHERTPRTAVEVALARLDLDLGRIAAASEQLASLAIGARTGSPRPRSRAGGPSRRPSSASRSVTRRARCRSWRRRRIRRRRTPTSS